MMGTDSSDSTQGETADERGLAPTALAAEGGIKATEAAIKRADAAGKVSRVITDTASPKRVPNSRRERSDFVRDESARARTSTGSSGKEGRRGQLKGHLFENLDIDDYNQRNRTAGKRLKKR